jgi:hypothetical protein
MEENSNEIFYGSTMARELSLQRTLAREEHLKRQEYAKLSRAIIKSFLRFWKRLAS